ncbi:hypothetical protein GUJ93_ZPchr0012g19781 [Zizania palustris]|uniref:Uncharacterized protein n=1 Tax=Zizania palustris TaxID=103762 RepID=A0A8J5WLV2_ZIZPA|nr:hypothetical protein GUJ93_ZPchr0012g19781 [Zizania palustris]
MMVLFDRSDKSLLPSFLYTSTVRSFVDASYSPYPSHSYCYQRWRTLHDRDVLPGVLRHLTAGGIASYELTHTVIMPLDLVKCNMQVRAHRLDLLLAALDAYREEVQEKYMKDDQFVKKRSKSRQTRMPISFFLSIVLT